MNNGTEFVAIMTALVGTIAMITAIILNKDITASKG